MLKYDIHTHVFPAKISSKVLAQLEEHYGIRPKGSGEVDDLLKRLQGAGLDRAVVHTAATAPAQVVPANNWSIELQSNYQQLLSFGSLHPDYENIENELSRLKQNKIQGLKFHPEFQGFRMDDHSFYELLQNIDSQFVLMFHVGDRLAPEDNPSCPAKVAAIKDTFPHLTIIAAHLGGYLHWPWVIESLVGRDIYLDTSSSLAYIEDSHLHNIFRFHPRERILFGSDYPLFDPGEELELLKKRLSLSNSEAEDILDNSNQLFKP